MSKAEKIEKYFILSLVFLTIAISTVCLFFETSKSMEVKGAELEEYAPGTEIKMEYLSTETIYVHSVKMELTQNQIWVTLDVDDSWGFRTEYTGVVSEVPALLDVVPGRVYATRTMENQQIKLLTPVE